MIELILFIVALIVLIQWIVFPFKVCSQLEEITEGIDCIYKILEKSKKSRQSSDS